MMIIATACFTFISIVISLISLRFLTGKKKLISSTEKTQLKSNSHKIFFCVILVTAIIVRLYSLGVIPYGLNQDEASIGYDSFAIGNYGYDRNGFHLPIYPIAFGNGHGPFYTYFSIPIVKALGLSVFSIRLTNALLSCIAAVVSYYLIKRLTQSKETALFGFALTATAPVLIISARWALDGCPPPSLFIIAFYLFIISIDAKKTLLYVLSAAFWGLVCYSYGPAAIVVLIFLPISCVYLVITKKIYLKHLIISGLTFMVVIAPISIFIARNYLDLPPINGLISFPRFTVMRTDSAILSIFDPVNFISGLYRLIFQPQDAIYNAVPGFGTTFMFTSPLIILGILFLIINIRLKQYNHFFLIAAYFISSLIMCGMIGQNVNRMSVVYPSIVLLITLAVHFMRQQSRYLVIPIYLFTLISFAGFSIDYFGEKYRQDFGSTFFYSLGDALEFAMDKTDRSICVTETNQNMSSVITLFYSKIPPNEYYETVKYYDDNAEFRTPMYFDRYSFGIPESIDSETVYVVVPSEESFFDPSVFEQEKFTYYTVMYPRVMEGDNIG